MAIDALAADKADQPSKPNVLFIAIDDLRPALGCYGDTVAVTPHIDQLAGRGTTFNRAYCQLAVCSPSRLSLLTGRRPDSIRVWDLGTHFRKAVPGAITLPQHFKNHGYFTQSVGKVFHGSGKPSKDPPSWSVDPQYDFVRDPKVRYALEKNLAGEGLKRDASESADVPDGTYIDGIVCDAAIRTLTDLREKNQPFFLAVGFRKPHLPFCAPKKYWDLYDPASIPDPVTDSHPQGRTGVSDTRSWMELEGYADHSQGREADSSAKSPPASRLLRLRQLRRQHGRTVTRRTLASTIGEKTPSLSFGVITVFTSANKDSGRKPITMNSRRAFH